MLSYQIIIKLHTNNDKTTRTWMVFPFKWIYEVTFYDRVICNCFSERIKQNLWLKFWKNVGNFEVSLKKKILIKKLVSSAVANNILLLRAICYSSMLVFLFFSLLFVCFKDWPEKIYQIFFQLTVTIAMVIAIKIIAFLRGILTDAIQQFVSNNYN